MVIEHNIGTALQFYYDEDCTLLVDIDCLWEGESFYIRTDYNVKDIIYYNDEIGDYVSAIGDGSATLLGCSYGILKYKVDVKCNTNYKILTGDLESSISVEYPESDVVVNVASSTVMATANQLAQGVLSLLQ